MLAAAVIPFTGLIGKIRIEGAENLPREGAYVLAPNHHSELDPLIVAVAVWRSGRAPRFMAKESLFRVPALGWGLRATGMIPVARTSSAASAKHTLDVSEQIVRDGRGVIVYPEGTLTRDPELWPMRGKTGAARLALEAGIPLIPVAQWGAQQVLPRYGRLRLWPPRRPMTVVFGEPLDLTPFAGSLTPSTLTEVTATVMDRLAEMLSRIRGIPAPTERWNPAQHGQKETGRLES